MSNANSDLHAIQAAAMSAHLLRVADRLMEARRYVRSHPAFAESEAKRAMRDIYADPPGATVTPHFVIVRARVVDNLCEGVRSIHHDPLILEGHLYAAARLLQSIARRIEASAEEGGGE